MHLGQTNYRRALVCGGVYNNYLALSSLLQEAQSAKPDAIFCLGDLGAFGPYPNRVYPLLLEGKVQVVQGNYDHSIGNDLKDCQCGYTDPRDNHFAQISYDYTLANTAAEYKAYQRALSPWIRFESFGQRILLCH